MFPNFISYLWCITRVKFINSFTMFKMLLIIFIAVKYSLPVPQT